MMLATVGACASMACTRGIEPPRVAMHDPAPALESLPQVSTVDGARVLDGQEQIACDVRGGAFTTNAVLVEALHETAEKWVGSPAHIVEALRTHGTPEADVARLHEETEIGRLGLQCERDGIALNVDGLWLGPFDVVMVKITFTGFQKAIDVLAWAGKERRVIHVRTSNRTWGGDEHYVDYVDLSAYFPAGAAVAFTGGLDARKALAVVTTRGGPTLALETRGTEDNPGLRLFRIVAEP